MQKKLKRKQSYAYQNESQILKVIKKSNDVEEIKDIRFKIISEMMQLKHIENQLHLFQLFITM